MLRLGDALYKVDDTENLKLEKPTKYSPYLPDNTSISGR